MLRLKKVWELHTMKITRSIFFHILVATILLFINTHIHAYSVSLKENIYDAKGFGAKQTIAITNSEDKTIGIEITPYKRVMDIMGNSQEIPLQQEMFIIYPNQLILKPGEEQIVNTLYIGPENIEQEEAYRLEIAEISLKNQDIIKKNTPPHEPPIFLTRYLKSIYVKPKGSKAKLQLASSELITSGNKKYAQIQIDNNGSAHALMENLNFTINKKLSATTTSATDPIHYTFPSNVVILPKNSRRFLIELPESFNNALGLETKYTFESKK